MQKWEYYYRTVGIDGFVDSTVTTMLNEFGTQGWELVSFSGQQDMDYKFIFKRMLVADTNKGVTPI